MSRIIALITTSLAVTLTITGCTLTGTTALLTGEKALEAFADIATTSCVTARDRGVVETTDQFTLVMVPTSEAIDGYSAAWAEPDMDPQVIYETDAFVSCYYGNTLSMLREAGKPLTQANIIVSQKTATSWDVTEAEAESGITRTEEYTVTDGVITRVDRGSGDQKRTITYGNPTGVHRAMFDAAIANLKAFTD